MNNDPRHDHTDSLDRILLSDDVLLPSSGFAASVMESIQQETGAPAPIAFPWKLALPGMAALVVCLAVLLRTFAIGFRSLSSPDFAPQIHVDFVLGPALLAAAPLAMAALAASWLCVFLCGKLATGWSTR